MGIYHFNAEAKLKIEIEAESLEEAKDMILNGEFSDEDEIYYDTSIDMDGVEVMDQ